MRKGRILTAVAIPALLVLVAVGCNWFSSKAVSSDVSMIRAKNYCNGKFMNLEPTAVTKPGTFWDTTYQYLFQSHKDRVPSQPLPVVMTRGFAQEPASAVRFLWLGHSTIFLELEGRRILFDPMLSERAGSFNGSDRSDSNPPRSGRRIFRRLMRCSYPMIIMTILIRQLSSSLPARPCLSTFHLVLVRSWRTGESRRQRFMSMPGGTSMTSTVLPSLLHRRVIFPDGGYLTGIEHSGAPESWFTRGRRPFIAVIRG